MLRRVKNGTLASPRFSSLHADIKREYLNIAVNNQKGLFRILQCKMILK
jgi:hypothetical protein